MALRGFRSGTVKTVHEIVVSLPWRSVAVHLAHRILTLGDVGWEEEPRWPPSRGCLPRDGLRLWESVQLCGSGPAPPVRKGLWPLGCSLPGGTKPLELSLICFPGEVTWELIIDEEAWEMTRKRKTGMFLDPETSLPLLKQLTQIFIQHFKHILFLFRDNSVIRGSIITIFQLRKLNSERWHKLPDISQ